MFAIGLGLAPGCRIEGSTGGVWVGLSDRHIFLAAEWDPFRGMLEQMASELRTAGDWRVSFESADAESGSRRWREILGRLKEAGLVQAVLADTSGPLARLEPIGADPGALSSTAPTEGARLSRFAFVRRVGKNALLESPNAPYRMHLLDARASTFVASLAHGVPKGRPLAPREVLTLELLEAGGFLEQGDAETDAWEFADLLFHVRSRLGRSEDPIGATFPGARSGPADPASKPVAAEAQLLRLGRTPLSSHQSLRDILGQRRSVLRYGRAPVRLDELTELLFAAASVQDVGMGGAEHPYETRRRSYPSGGALHSLEIYPVVLSVDGLLAGVYRYDAVEHALETVRLGWSPAEELFAAHGLAPRSDMASPVLLLVTSRFRRVSWKYSRIAYSLVLKEVGALYQTLYLVATDLGLAPCAWGAGNPTKFASITGISEAEEPTVGEFLVGPLP